MAEELSTARPRKVLEAMRKAADGKNGSFRERLIGIIDAKTAVLLAFADEGVHACDLALDSLLNGFSFRSTVHSSPRQFVPPDA